MATRYRTAHVCDGEERLVIVEPGYQTGFLVILHDPDEAGGFSAGASLPIQQVVCMLQMSTFNLGTVVQHPLFGVLTVVKYKRHWVRQGHLHNTACQGLRAAEGSMIVPTFESAGRLYKVNQTRPDRRHE